MLKFIQILQQVNVRVPERIIFTNEDKLPFQGYQWVPSSFMLLDNVDVEFLVDDYEHGRLASFDDKGIYIRTAGFSLEFELERTEIQDRFKFRVSNSAEVYSVTPRTALWPPGQRRRLWDHKVRGRRIINPAVVVSIHSSSYGHGILVTKYRTENIDDTSVIHFAHLLSPVNIFESSNMKDSQTANLEIVGRPHDHKQLWCIG